MYLLDTNTVIDFFNAKLPQKGIIFLTNTAPFISVVTRIELFASTMITEQEKLLLEEFVQMATIFDSINEEIVKQTILIRQQNKVKLPDAIIAATAIVHQLTLVTRNTSDFNNIDGLDVINLWNL